MREEVARAVLAAYPHKKLTGAMAREIVTAWANASGWHRDRWDNWHPREGIRIKLTKQRVQRQKKRFDGKWSNVRSTPMIEAAQNVVKKAATALGDEEVLVRIEGARTKRKTAQKRRQETASAEERKRAVEDMAAKVISMERPMGFVTMYETDKPSREFGERYLQLTGQIDRLQKAGRMPADQDFFRTTQPPIAPVLIDTKADWVEEVDGVPYTVTLRHADSDRAVIEIGSIGTMGLTNRVDPITKAAVIDFEAREGDSYASGYVQRRKGKGPVGLLFFIQSQDKQRGAGSRILDLWCNLMDSFGVDVWLAEAVGDEGMAFLDRKVEQGRLENLGQSGANIAMRCIGGYRGRQQPLPFVKNPADILSFPERPERVEIGNRSYALSDVGVPMNVFDADIDVEPPEESARVIDMGGERFRYIWIHEPESDRLEMYRYSDGEWKVLSNSREFPGTFDKLRKSGQLNVVSPEQLEAFEAEMRQRSDATLASLKSWWEEEKGDEQHKVDQLVAAFFDEKVRPVVEQGFVEVDQGVYPFDFEFNERIADFSPREQQARMHVLLKAMEREGFNHGEDSPLESYVLQGLGYGSWEDLEDQQAIQWAFHDFLDEKAYPLAKRRQGRGKRGYVP